MIKKFLFTIFLGLSAFANSLTVGSDLPVLTVKDQFEKESTIDSKIKTVISITWRILLILFCFVILDLFLMSFLHLSEYFQ